MTPLTVKPKAIIKPHWPIKSPTLPQYDSPEAALDAMMKDAEVVRSRFKGGHTGNTIPVASTSKAMQNKQKNAEKRRIFIYEFMLQFSEFMGRGALCDAMAVAGWDINPDTLTNDLGILFRTGRVDRQGAGNRVKYMAIKGEIA